MASCNRDSPVVAAIDIGTSYSGYAVQFYEDFKKDPIKIFSPQTWNGGKINLSSLKTPTCLLLNEKQEIDAFGFQAEDRYANLCIDKENDKYYFFRRFKMKLMEGEGLKRTSMIEDETGKKCLALDVFALSIKCLKIHLMEMLKKQGTGVEKEDIFWVLTVPAIWNDAAKQFMREAAQKADIDTEKLAIALEPEAASIYCHLLPVDRFTSQAGKVQFGAAPPGTKYMIVDLGGGTADMTVHEKLGDGKLKEIWKASGGPWGGTAVDSAFFQMLISIVSGPVMSRFMKEHTYDYLDLFREFESAKRNFSTSSKDKINIKFPVTLNELCEDMLGSTFKKCTSESVHGNDISFVSDKMRLTPGLLEMLFRKVTYNIIDHIKGILSTGPGRKVSLILMVGGFSESQFVQEVIFKEFHGKNGIQIVIPRDAGSTVVNGAVLFGRMPRSIESRILRYTYGTNSCPVFDEKVHPEEKKIIIDGLARCSDVFSLIIAAGTEIKSDVKLRKSCITAEKNQRAMGLSFYYSLGKTPTFTTDEGCHLLGKLRIEIPNPSTEDRHVDLTYEFGSTELKVTAVERTSNKPCNATFKLIE